MARRIEFFYDYVSPFSYLANSQLAALAERTGADVEFRPFFLGGVMKATGNSPPLSVPAKGKYMLSDIQRWASEYDVPIKFNPSFPINTIQVMRAAVAAQELGVFAVFHEAVFRAMWVDEVDLGDPAFLRGVLEKAGLDAEAILARAAEQEVKDRLRANTDEAVERGAFGAPTWFVGEEMFFGNDRVPFVEKALALLPE